MFYDIFPYTDESKRATELEMKMPKFLALVLPEKCVTWVIFWISIHNRKNMGREGDREGVREIKIDVC